MDHAPFNLIIIAITCWISYLGFKQWEFEQRYIFWPQAILAGREYYRLLSSGFLHANGAHLAMNMVSLFFLGPAIEQEYGATQFLLIYFAGIVGGNLLSLWIHRHHDYRAYGASGGVCGIVFAHIFLFPGGRLMMLYLPIPMPSWLYALVFLGGSFYALKSGQDNVGHDAHLGGALVSLFTVAALHPSIIQYNPVLFGVVVVATALLFLYLVKNPLFLPMRDVGWSWKPRFAWPWRRARVKVLPDYQPEPRRLDAILEKVSDKGIESLTPEERQFLDSVSIKYRDRATSKKPKSGLAI